MKRKYFAYPYVLWMLCLILAPMLLIVFYAFSQKIDTKLVFSLQNIKEAFNPMYLNILGKSLMFAAGTTLLCLVLAYPIAYALSKMKKRSGAIMSVIFILPMWMNMLLRTYAWMGLLQKKGLLNQLLSFFGWGPYNFLPSRAAVLLGLVYNFLPFMIMPIYNVLQRISKENIEAGEDLGANGMQIFFRLILPQSVPGIISGISMVFVPSISTFAVSRLLGGGKAVLYGDVIESLFTTANNWNLGSALSLILSVLVGLSMLVTMRLEKGNEREALL